MSDDQIRVDSTEAKARFEPYLDQIDKYSVIVRKSGKDVAILISLQEYERLQAMKEELRLKTNDPLMTRLLTRVTGCVVSSKGALE